MQSAPTPIRYMRRLPREACVRQSAITVALRRVARFTMLAALPTLGLLAAAHAFGVRLNFSPSIAPGVYRVTNGPIERGVTVIVCLPGALSAVARSRGYISAGSCPDGNAPIGKRVAAVAGDTVVVAPSGLSVNGRALTNTHRLGTDHRGQRLPHVPDGRYLVPVGQIWLVSTYSPRSFDSRYFGPLSTGAVVNRVQPIITVR